MLFHRKILSGMALLSLLLASCTPASTSAPPTGTVLVPTATSEPTATPVPPRSLSVCLGQEPTTLFAYKGSSRSMWTVLESIYDGPIDSLTAESKPVILEKIPTIANGGVLTGAIEVKAGYEVVDVEGDLKFLSQGVRVYPSGCTSQNCAVIWDGKTPLQMDQVSVTFRLHPGLTWSDGAPLNALDSVYSFNLAADKAIPTSKELTARTVEYTAVDDSTIRWVGVPGFLPPSPESNFWLPMPKHVWEQLKPASLLESEEANLRPLGWGPYILKEWVKGDHITLERNPNYFRASEGLPHFDSLVFRFLGEPADNNLEALLSGECDIVDQTSMLEEQLEPVLELQRDKKLTAYIQQGPEWEQVNFGIVPSSYDDGYNAYTGDRPDFFSDLRMRQAFTACMDRQGIIQKPLENQTSVPVGFYPPGHPLSVMDILPQPFNPAAGISLLEEVGWKELDGDPNTPRVAAGVAGIPNGTPLAVNYLTTQAPLRVEIAKRLAVSMAQCGIQVNVQYSDPGTLYAQGPDGPLFGRNFDLAEFGWEAGTRSPCWLYESGHIPGAKNNWLGVNITGYLNPAFDQACTAALSASPDQANYLEQQLAVQRLFAEELPAVPIYFRMKMAVSRPDFCGLTLDVNARSLLWNLEELNYGEGCTR